MELCAILLVGSFLASSFTFTHYGLFLLPFAVSATVPSSPHVHWLTWGALFCVGGSVGWNLRFLPGSVNDVLAERFTLGLLMLLSAFWVGSSSTSESHVATRARPGLDSTADEVALAPSHAP